MSLVSCMIIFDDLFEKRMSMVGRVMLYMMVKIVDLENKGRILLIGEKGELVVVGYLVMKGYWGDEGRMNEVRVVEWDEDG